MSVSLHHHTAMTERPDGSNGRGRLFHSTCPLLLTRAREMDLAEKISRFLQWLQQNGAIISDQISIQDYSDQKMGLGIMAIEPIKKDCLLCKIPRSLTLSRHTTEHRDSIKKQAKNSQWNQAIWAVILERRNQNSHWRPYFDMLPKDISTPMSWSKTEKALLKGSYIYSSIDDEELFVKFEKDSRRMNLRACEQEYFFAGDLLSSYSFLEDGSPPEDVTLVPVADLFNHSSTNNNARLFYAKDFLEMVSIKDIAEGEQIFNTFGKLSNSQLLLKYGFIEKINPYNSVAIELQTILMYIEDDSDVLHRLYVKGFVKEEYKLTPESDAGLSVLFSKLKKSFKEFLVWQSHQYCTTEIPDPSERQYMASIVCTEELQIINGYINRIGNAT